MFFYTLTVVKKKILCYTISRKYLYKGSITKVKCQIYYREREQIMMKLLVIWALVLSAVNSYAGSIVWDKTNNFSNWRYFFNVRGKVENGVLKLYNIKFDPQMSNRAVTIDPRKFDTLIFTCKVNGSGPKKPGEFYFWQAGGKANPKQSWRLPELICDGKYHTYTIRPDDLSTWLACGTVSGIRLDVTNSAGGEIEISGIRLEKGPAVPTDLVWSKDNNFKNWKYFLHSKGRISNGLISFIEIKRDCGVEARNLPEIDPALYNTLAYTYRAENTTNTRGQFFFRTSQEKFSGKKKILLPKMIADSQWHTIECRIDNAAWLGSGKITGLRLDPTDTAGGTIDISEIKLFKKDYPQTVTDKKKLKKQPQSLAGKLDAPRWQPVKPELWKKMPAILSVPGKYYQGGMIRSPQDLYKGGKFQDFYLRKTFTLAETPAAGFLQFTADDCVQAFINGKLTGSANDWRTGSCVDVSKYLKAGKNVLAFHYVNSATYGGVLAELYIQYADGSSERINSDKTFKSSVHAPAGWLQTGFDDSSWQTVIEQPAPPAAPWKVVIPYKYFANMQKIVQCSVIPKTAEAGKNLTFKLKCQGPMPEKPFQADIILKRENNEFLRDKTVISRQNMTSLGNNIWLLEFTYPVHRYTSKGKFTVELTSDIFTVGGDKLQFSVKNLSYDPELPRYVSFKVNRQAKRPFFELQGKPFYPVWMTGSGFTPGKLNVVTVYPGFLHWQNGAGRINTDVFDQAAIQALRKYPDAYFMWNLQLDTSYEWTERNPQELCRDEDNKILVQGGHARYSFSSRLARQEMENNLIQAINYLENSPYSNRIIGYRITGGYTIEWLGWESLNGKALDFAPCAVEGFKKFAAEYYPQLKNPYVPTARERLARDGKSLLPDPQKHLNLIAYNDFTSHAVADMMLHLCRKAKELAGKNKVIGTYYGYTSTLNFTGKAHHRAHFALKKVLDAGVIDYLMSPQSYQLRALGETCGDMKPFATFQHNGIISVLENDQRTHCSLYDTKTSGGRYQTINKEQTINIFRRDMIMNIIRNHPTLAIAIISKHEFDFPEMVPEVEVLKTLGSWCLNKKTERKADIALVVSEENIKSMPRIGDFASSGIIDQSYRGDGSVRTELREKPVLNFETFIGNQALFNRSGAAVDHLLAEDLADHPGDYKLYVFLNCYKYDEKFQKAVAKLQQKKCVLLWLYAPGFIKGAESSLENMQQLTGMKFEKFSVPYTSVVQFPDKRVMGTPEAKVTPLFAVNDPAAEVLARYRNGKAGVAMVRHGNALSIFSGAWQLDLDFINFLLKKAGIFQYSTSYDPLDASDNVIMFHARTPGRKEIKLPYKTDVLDVYSKKITARNTDKFSTDLKLHETKCFYYGNDAESLLAELKKIK